MKINISDSNGRSAVVIARPISSTPKTRLLQKCAACNGTGFASTETDPFDICYTCYGSYTTGTEAKYRRVLKGAVDASNPLYVDLEAAGRYVTDAQSAYMNESTGELVYSYREQRLHIDLNGEVTEVERPEPNVNTEVPLRWTGKYISVKDAVRRFVFSRQVQIVHTDILSYDFLFKVAEDLAYKGQMMLITAGKERLVFTRTGLPYVGFLHGQVQEGRYILRLLLSNQELKRP